MATKNPNQSELWERLRAARHYADLTQAAVSKHLGVSRAAIALHESRNVAIRTRPSAEQVMRIGLLTGLPPEYLLSDAVRVEDVWKYAGKPAGQAAPAPAHPPALPDPTPPRYAGTDDRGTVTALAAMLAKVEPGRLGSVTSTLSDLARSPQDPGLVEVLILLLADKAFAQARQKQA